MSALKYTTMYLEQLRLLFAVNIECNY